MERFNSNMLCDMEVREQNQLEASERLAASQNLGGSTGIRGGGSQNRKIE
jgi:hypothetical protein